MLYGEYPCTDAASQMLDGVIHYYFHRGAGPLFSPTFDMEMSDRTDEVAMNLYRFLFPKMMHLDLPMSIACDSRHLDAVTFADRRDPKRRMVIRPQFTIDAEIEGDVCHLPGVSTTLGREARGPSDDPTRDNESFAGRLFTPAKKIGSLVVAGGALLDGSTQQADEAPATMAWNGSVTLKDYGVGTPESPWVLAKQPAGYDPADFAWWETGTYGVTLDEQNRRWNIDQFLSTIEGWRLPDGRHVLESMDT